MFPSSMSGRIRILVVSSLVFIIVLGCTKSENPEECNLVPQSHLSVLENKSIDSPSAIWQGASAIFVRGQEVYIGFGNSVLILDVTNPADPKPISSISLPVPPSLPVGEVGSLQLIGDYLHLYFNQYSNENGWFIIDVSDPIHPIEVGCEEENLIKLNAAALSGDYAYIPLGDADREGFLIYDFTNPSTIIEVGAYQPETVGRFSGEPLFTSRPKIVTSIDVIGDYAYIGENFPGGDSLYNGQLRILDITTPKNPELVSVYNMPYRTGITRVVAMDKYVFASAYGWFANGELTVILDVSDPNNPIELYEFSLGRLATSFEDFAYFIDSGRIAIWDISDPSSPIEAGHIDLPPNVHVSKYDVFALDDYLYIAMQGAGLQIYNNVDPINPIKIGSFP